MDRNNQVFKDLLDYIRVLDQACLIFHLTFSFPKEEKYSLIDQIRRFSSSVCANLAEPYRKGDYPKYFLLKITNFLDENSKTLVWLDFSQN
jgi:four helix bundle protein